MADQLANLQHVFDKWDKRGPLQTHSTPTVSTTTGDRTSQIIKEGRLKWKNKFGDVPKPVLQRRQRNYLPKLPLIQTNFAAFKSSPTILAEQFRQRQPYLNPNCKCINITRRELDRSQFSELGIYDILNVDRQLRNANIFVRTCSHLSYITHRRTYFSYSNITEKVLNSDRLRSAISDKALSLCEAEGGGTQMAAIIDRLSKSAVKTLGNMRARLSNFIMILSGWVLMKFFTRLLSHIQVHQGQMQLIKAAAERELPMLYLPSHRSHLDYILITVVLWLHNIRVPHIAAGENLNLPIFSYFMKRQGAFFIRRRLDKNLGQKDTIYRALLHSYMEEILKAGESLEFFVEGGRSRTGKPYQPKAGLLSVVVESCLQGVIDDVYMVPVSINYERILDGEFSHEQMGKGKTKETFTSVVRGLWSLFTSHYGSVRIDFSQPFSLKEYIHTCQTEQSTISCSDSDSPTSPLSSTNLSRHDSFYTGQFLVDSQRTFINNVARHIVYNAMQSLSLMCTNLVAFLLLTKHRQGTSLRQLEESFTSLVYQITNVHKHDVSFSGKNRDVVIYACNLLGQKLALSGRNGCVGGSVVPNLTLPGVFNLMYYSNAVVPLFITESIVACCVMSLSGLSLAVVQSLSVVKSASVNRQLVVKTAMELCNLLQNEFLFVSPCMNLETILCETVDDLITSEIIAVHHNTYCGTSHEETQWVRRFERQLRWQLDENDDSDEEGESQLIQLNMARPDLISKLVTYHEIVAPYAEAFCLVVDHLLQLGDAEVPEDDFMTRLHREASERCEKGVALYVEHAALETLRNCIRSLETLHYVHTYYVGTLRMIGRYDHQDTEPRLRRLREFASSFLI